MTDNLLFYVILTAVAAFAGSLGLGVSQWMSSGLKSSTRRVFQFLLSVILWPFRWVVTGFKEWRRVSGYRHRDLTWDDLPQESKNKVMFDDLSDLAQRLINWHHLSEVSKHHVSFQDLGDEARSSIKVKDLPRDQKFSLLDQFIMPKLHGVPHEGKLAQFEDKMTVSLSETAQVTIDQALRSGSVQQDRMQLTLKISFINPGTDFPIPMGKMIGFSTDGWVVLGTVNSRVRTDPDAQTVVVWVTNLIFESLIIYQPTS